MTNKRFNTYVSIYNYYFDTPPQGEQSFINATDAFLKEKGISFKDAAMQSLKKNQNSAPF